MDRCDTASNGAMGWRHDRYGRPFRRPANPRVVQNSSISRCRRHSQGPPHAAPEWYDAAISRDDRTSPLPLLPFGVDELLLPGERLQLHLFEARFLALYEMAASTCHGCVGQLLVNGEGGYSPVTTLLEVEQVRRRDVGAWARVRCVGRVKLKRLRDDDATQSFPVADAEPFADVRGTSTPRDDQADVRTLYDATAAMERRLGLPDEAGPSRPDGGDGGEEIAWGHERRRGGPRGGPFELSLDAAVAQRFDVLGSPISDANAGGDAGGASSHPPSEGMMDSVLRLRKLWGVTDEAEVRAHVLSFAAAGPLDATERWAAMAETDAQRRLARVRDAIATRQRRLAAELALEAAAGGGSGMDPSS